MGQSGHESSLFLRTGLEQGMLHQDSVVKPKEQSQQKRREENAVKEVKLESWKGAWICKYDEII